MEGLHNSRDITGIGSLQAWPACMYLHLIRWLLMITLTTFTIKLCP